MSIEAMTRKTEGAASVRSAMMKTNAPPATHAKIMKAGPGDKASVAVLPNSVDISAPMSDDADTVGISVTENRGVIIKGQVGFTETPDKIRLSYLWTLNPLVLSGMPSTVMTPIPMTKFSPPLEALIKMAALPSVIAALGAT